MIIIGIGANLSHPQYGSPRRTCGAMMARMNQCAMTITARSSWYHSAPVLTAGHGAQGPQPWYVNAAACIETDMDPHALLDALHTIEAEFGRERSIANAPRTLDLDIIAYDERVMDTPDLIIPHAHLNERAFVLLPLMDIAPHWRHPITDERASEMIGNLVKQQGIEALPDAEGVFGTEWEG